MISGLIVELNFSRPIKYFEGNMYISITCSPNSVELYVYILLAIQSNVSKLTETHTAYIYLNLSHKANPIPLKTFQSLEITT